MQRTAENERGCSIAFNRNETYLIQNVFKVRINLLLAAAAVAVAAPHIETVIYESIIIMGTKFVRRIILSTQYIRTNLLSRFVWRTQIVNIQMDINQSKSLKQIEKSIRNDCKPFIKQSGELNGQLNCSHNYLPSHESCNGNESESNHRSLYPRSLWQKKKKKT